jgi:hypothetical protein
MTAFSVTRTTGTEREPGVIPMKNRWLALALALALLTHSPTLLAQARCVFVTMGGDLAWISLLGNLIGESTDIAIQIDSAIKKEARRTGCTLVSINNDDEAGFLRQVRELGERHEAAHYHLAFTGHNFTGSLKPLEAPFIVGNGHETTFGRFLDALKDGLPRGSRVTFHSNTCFPMMSEAVVAKKLDTHFDICGSSSTVPWRASYNYRQTFEFNGRRLGGYGVMGFQQWDPSRPLDVAGFHAAGKQGDAANAGRQPGLTTSQAFALATLQARFPRRISPLGMEDLDARLNSVPWKASPSLSGFLARSPEEILRDTSYLLGRSSRPDEETDSARQYVRNAYGLLTSLQSSDMEPIPEPYHGQARRAREWLGKYSTNLLSLLVRIAREKSTMLLDLRAAGSAKSPETDPRWADLESVHSLWLHDYKVQFRILQEAQLVQSFLLSATPAERSRYLKLVTCESRPLM